MAGPVAGVLNEAEALAAAGSGAAFLNLTEAEGLRVNEAGVGVGAGALPGLGGLAAGSEEALSAAMDARGGKHRRMRCSSI